MTPELAAIGRYLATTRIGLSKQEEEAAELRRNITVQETDQTEIRKVLAQALAPTVNGAHQDPSATTKFDRTELRADKKGTEACLVSLTDELAQMKQHFSSSLLKKSASGIFASLRGPTYRSVRLASSFTAALLDSHFEHPASDLALST
jgi:hypothetical protein